MAERLAKKVLLIGWDAADWALINPLLDTGQMPVLENFVNEGVMGNLATSEPILSPILWTSIATGKMGDKHGILGFIEPDPSAGGVRVVTSTSRKCKAVWNILTQQGLRCNVVDWYASHPAEPIAGVDVSNLYSKANASLDEPWPLQPGTVHPERLSETLADLRIHANELEWGHLLPFVPSAAKIDHTKDPHVAFLARTLAQCASVHNAATWLMENEPWDFMGIYYSAIDTICHRFMLYHPPKMDGVSDEDFQNYQEVVSQTYRYHDMMLGRLLELAGDDTTVIICSDHGFLSGSRRLKDSQQIRHGPSDDLEVVAEMSLWHRQLGIVCMKGPYIKRDERVYGACVFDIAPTVLTLFGLPIADDMDGRPMVQAFEQPFQPEVIPSWEEVPGESGMHPPDHLVDSFDAQAAIRQLVDLGYIDPPDEDGEKAAADAARDLKFNLVVVLITRGRPDEAVPVLEELVGENPDDSRFLFPLAQCYFKLGQIDKCRMVAEKAIGLEKYQGRVNVLMGLVCAAEGNREQALRFLELAEKVDPSDPLLHCRIGAFHTHSGRWEDAKNSYRKAIMADSDLAIAHDGLAVALLGQKRWEDAAEAALAAVGLRHHFADAHFHLGLALAGMGVLDRAIQAFETCLVVRPPVAMAVSAHQCLADIYERALGDVEKAAEHRRLAEELTSKQDGAPHAATGEV